jgi:hypothetical protein
MSLSNLVYDTSRRYLNVAKQNSINNGSLFYNFLSNGSNSFLKNDLLTFRTSILNKTNISSYSISSSTESGMVLNTHFDENVPFNKSFEQTSVYLGHHFDLGSTRSFLSLPGLLPVEKEACFFNCEGRIQVTNPVIPTPKGIKAYSDWKYLDFDRSYSWEGILDSILSSSPSNVLKDSSLYTYNLSQIEDKCLNYYILNQNTLLFSKTKNFYLSDVVSRASSVMGRCAVSKCPSTYFEIL